MNTLKKEKLYKVYMKASQYLKQAYKGLKSNNVEEVQWWLGDLFILLCENKEIIDKSIYEKIAELKDELMDSVSTILFFHSRFKNQKNLDSQMKNVINIVDTRIADIKLFLQAIE